MRDERKNLREFRAYRAVQAVGRVAPFWLLQSVGAALGVLYLLASRRRRVVLRNLRRVFPRRSGFSRLIVALRCGAHFGRISFDFIKWSQAGADSFQRKVRCEGIENLRAALAQGNGCFILSAHFGHWEVAAQWLALAGLPQGMVYRPLENPLMEAELARARTRFGNWLIPKGSATRGAVKAVRGGRVVDLLLDQKADLEHSEVVSFLGIPTPTTPSLARLVRATGAAVVPLFSYPEGTGYRFRLDPALPDARNDSVAALTERYNDCVSREVLQQPHLWFWFHDRWTPRRRRNVPS